MDDYDAATFVFTSSWLSAVKLTVFFEESEVIFYEEFILGWMLTFIAGFLSADVIGLEFYLTAELTIAEVWTLLIDPCFLMECSLLNLRASKFLLSSYLTFCSFKMWRKQKSKFSCSLIVNLF